MTKEEFNTKTVYEQIEYINTKLKEGLSLTKAAEYLDISRKTIANRFSKENYKFDKVLNQYVRQMEDNQDITSVEVVEENSLTNMIQIDQQKKLLDIVNNHDKIMDVLSWFDTREDNCPTEIIEVKQGLQIDYNKSNPTKTTVRVDKKVWDEFSKLCEDTYSQYSKIDLLSQALEEFIKKYKRV